MNKKMLFMSLGIVLLLAVFVVAQAGPTIKNGGKSFSKRHKDALARMNLSAYDYNDYYTDADNAQRCLKHSYEVNRTVMVGNASETFSETVSVINTCENFKRFEMVCADENCTTMNRNNFSEAEMETIMDDWEQARLEGIAEAQLSREARALEVTNHIRTGRNSNKQR